MELKEKIKREIDQMPEHLLRELQKFLTKIKKHPRRPRKIPTLHLKGQYDTIDIRKKSYE